MFVKELSVFRPVSAAKNLEERALGFAQFFCGGNEFNLVEVPAEKVVNKAKAALNKF